MTYILKTKWFNKMYYPTPKSWVKLKPFKFGNMDLQGNCNESLANLLQICKGNWISRNFALDLWGIHCKFLANLQENYEGYFANSLQIHKSIILGFCLGFQYIFVEFICIFYFFFENIINVKICFRFF